MSARAKKLRLYIWRNLGRSKSYRQRTRELLELVPDEQLDALKLETHKMGALSYTACNLQPLMNFLKENDPNEYNYKVHYSIKNAVIKALDDLQLVCKG